MNGLHPFLFGCFVLVAGALVAPLHVLADELPKDPGTIQRLTPEQARTLVAGFKGPYLHLGSLTSLDAETARALAGFEGQVLDFFGLRSLGVDAAEALAGFHGHALNLSGLTKLDAATAAALAAFDGDRLGLFGLTTLDADAATSLAKFKGKEIHLHCPTTIEAATAKALARFKGQGLHLDSLTKLDAETARALAEFKGRISLAGNLPDEFVAEHPLTPQAALAYARLFDGVLPFLTAFDFPGSVETAKFLAARKGPLWLPNLKKISPQALSALIAKEDAEIPPIETLEIIAEPDGGPADDFVVPKGLHERQQKQWAARAAREAQ